MAPDFKLLDLDGKSRQLSSFKGGNVVLFFFCGCTWCHETAREWSHLERLAVNGGMAYVRDAKTVIVYSGAAAEARQFEKDTELDPKTTAVLIDSDSTVSSALYNAEPCPRVFVLGASQKVLYTNDHADDAPRSTDESVLIASVAATLAGMVPPAAHP